MISFFLYVCGLILMAILWKNGTWYEETKTMRFLGMVFWPVTAIIFLIREIFDV